MNVIDILSLVHIVTRIHTSSHQIHILLNIYACKFGPDIVIPTKNRRLCGHGMHSVCRRQFDRRFDSLHILHCSQLAMLKGGVLKITNHNFKFSIVINDETQMFLYIFFILVIYNKQRICMLCKRFLCNFGFSRMKTQFWEIILIIEKFVSNIKILTEWPLKKWLKR